MDDSSGANEGRQGTSRATVADRGQTPALPRIEGTTLLFPSTKNTPLSDMTLTGVLRRMGVKAVPHGFRSTFSDWAAERTNFPREVVRNGSGAYD